MTLRNEALLEWAKTAPESAIAATGTTRDYLKQIAYGHKTASLEMAVRIEAASEGAVTRQELRPDDWREMWPELAMDHHDSGFLRLRPLEGDERRCVLECIRDAVGTEGRTTADNRARIAAKAALVGIATMNGLNGPVVYKHPYQDQRGLALELEEMASRLRREADEWDASTAHMQKSVAGLDGTHLGVASESGAVQAKRGDA